MAVLEEKDVPQCAVRQRRFQEHLESRSQPMGLSQSQTDSLGSRPVPAEQLESLPRQWEKERG